MSMFHRLPIINILQRFAFLVVLPFTIWLSLDLTFSAAVTNNLFDASLFFLCFYSLARYASRTTSVFTADGPMDKVQWLTMSLFYYSVSFILAVIWSVRWRATGHLASFGEDDLRAAFRYTASLGTMSSVLAQGDYEVRIPPSRWVTIVALVLAAFAGVVLALYADSMKGYLPSLWPHDVHVGARSLRVQ